MFSREACLVYFFVYHVTIFGKKIRINGSMRFMEDEISEYSFLHLFLFFVCNKFLSKFKQCALSNLRAAPDLD